MFGNPKELACLATSLDADLVLILIPSPSEEAEASVALFPATFNRELFAV